MSLMALPVELVVAISNPCTMALAAASDNWVWLSTNRLSEQG